MPVCPISDCSNERGVNHVCCRRCWFDLPVQVRKKIKKLYDQEPGGDDHRAAIADAIQWLDDKRKEEASAP